MDIFLLIGTSHTTGLGDSLTPARDNTVVFSKKYGDWIINDITNVATRMVDENNTFHLPLWVPVFTRPA